MRSGAPEGRRPSEPMLTELAREVPGVKTQDVDSSLSVMSDMAEGGEGASKLVLRGRAWVCIEGMRPHSR